MKKNAIITLIISILFSLPAALFSQDFRKEFFQGNWVENIGFKGYEFKTDTFNVMDYGAKNKGIFLTTKEIQDAIDACELNGGGVVYIPDGAYHVGSLFLKSNIHLLLGDSVRLLGSMDLDDYRKQHTRIAGVEMEWPMAMINVVDAINVKISGSGTVNGRGKPFWAEFWNSRYVYEAKGVRWAIDYDIERPRMILIQESSNVHITGLTLKESAFWTVHLLYSNRVTVDRVTIRNNMDGEHGPSTDGIDIDSSEDILVEQCNIDCNDDNFCLKAGRDADGLRVNRPCRYIVLRHNITRGGEGLFSLGSETSGGINHVYVHDMKAEGTNAGIRFKSARTRGGVLEDILVENVEIVDVDYVFRISMNWNPAYSYTELPEGFAYESIPEKWRLMLQRVEPEEKGYCRIRNVLISNLEARDCEQAFFVEGFEHVPVEGLRFEYTRVSATSGGTITYAKGWEAKNASFIFENGKAPEMTGCKGISQIFK
ncbi:MAG: glycosyl hydrolase family 28 protein [Bacteroidota bacterium]